MDCNDYEALAVDLLYGDLSPERRAEASAHASGCPECGKLSRELDEARQTAASLPSRIAPPPELDERVMLAARMAVDVRKQPLRGSNLHVAAAAVLAALLTGVSFVAGFQVGKPKQIRIVDNPYENPQLTVRPKDGGAVEISNPAGPPKRYNADLAEVRKYQEGLLAMANEDLAKNDAKRALTEFGGVFTGGGRTQMALEARIGMARCHQSLGQIEDARLAAKDALLKNEEWTLRIEEIDREALRLINELKPR